MPANSVVQKAITAIAEVDAKYWSKTLAQRVDGPEAAGSVVVGISSAASLEELLLKTDWEEYSHPDVMAECQAFKAMIPGRLGVTPLAALPKDTVVTLDDRKGTGKVSCTVKGIRGQQVDFTVLIVGTEDGREVCFTFHPGDPVRPSQIQTESGMHGRQVAV